jgi:predicted transcriptional regulator of viral defense system
VVGPASLGADRPKASGDAVRHDADVPSRHWKLENSTFEVRRRPARSLFGTREVTRDGRPVDISDRERTLLDCLDDLSLGGGLRHTGRALGRYAARADVNWPRLFEYADRLANPALFKRLGYLGETLGFADKQLLDACHARVAGGAERLDPERPACGPISSRWRLHVNATAWPDPADRRTRTSRAHPGRLAE